METVENLETMENVKQTKKVEKIRKIEKRPLKRKSMQEKLDILREIDEGSCYTAIAERHNLTLAAVTQIKKRKFNIIESATNYNWENQKNKVKLKNMYLDEAVYIWFKQKRSLGEPLSGPILCETAKLLNTKLNGPPTFKASNGWLDKFKRRYGFRQVSIQGEKMLSTNEVAKEFAEDLRRYITEQGIQRENIYNADETELSWKSLPKKNEVDLVEETMGSSYEEEKDRITTLFCANATGTHKLPLLVISKSATAKPKCFKKISKLPVIFKEKSSAWMDRGVFIDWFKNSFISSVLAHQEENNIIGKVLLILDNGHCHPPAEDLNSLHPNFEVIYLPPNVTANVQPMAQGPIQKTKRSYKKNFLLRILLQDTERSVEDYLKRYTLNYCCNVIAATWNQISELYLRRSWKYLLVDEEVNTDNEPTEDESVLITSASEFLSSSNSNVISWLQSDNDGPGWKVLTDDDIIDLVAPNINVESAPEETTITCKEAADIFDKGYKWLERQPECQPLFLDVLQTLKNLAEQKI